MNKIILIGNLTKDPKLKYTSKDVPLCTFSIAVNRTRSSTENQNADFFNIVVFDKNAENCNKYLSKGKKVAVSGTVRISNYTNDSNENKTKIEVYADQVDFLSKSDNWDDESKKERSPSPRVSRDDYVPF